MAVLQTTSGRSLMYRKNVGPRMGPSGKLTWMRCSCKDFTSRTTQSCLLPTLTKKWKNKADKTTWASRRLNFKKIIESNPVKSLEVPAGLFLSNSIRCNSQEICIWCRISETLLDIIESPTFLEVINKPVICKAFKDFTNHRKRITLQ